MNTVVIEHVALDELPAAWRARFPVAPNARVTVRIEEETEQTAQAALADNPLFGMWQDREDTADVAAQARGLRAPRNNDGPVYLDDEVQTWLATCAGSKGIDLSTLVNNLLREAIGIIEAGR